MESSRNTRAIAWRAATVVIGFLAWPGSAIAQSHDDDRRHDDVSPIHQVEPRVRDHRHDREDPDPVSVRSIDGSGNRLEDPEHNATHTALLRTVSSDYSDGVSAFAGADRPSARDVSNAVNVQTELVANPFNTSDFLWQWGQFVDHDIDLTGGVDPPEFAHILVSSGDPEFDPTATGDALISFNRSTYDPETGTDSENPREQLNEITAWIDASNVYGSDAVRATALRTNDGTGRLATSAGNLLPNSDGTLPNATGGSSQILFLAGDIRVNEQLGLTALHTLFVREHNRLANEIRRKKKNRKLDGDTIYQRARREVGALIQVITYEEFLPALLGPGALEPYRGDDPNVDARIANEFSTAAFRFGHSALPPMLQRLDENRNETAEGHVGLRDAFFNPDRIRNEGGIDPILRGLAFQRHQRIDLLVIDDVRNFLFGRPGSGGFDLAALNIQRGRDHGLASYNDVREAYGFGRATDYAEISAEPEVQSRLAAAYDSVDDVDLWVGCLAEDPRPPSQVGPLVYSMLVEQFTALRDGDRFWYQNTFAGKALAQIRNTRLADVIRRNTRVGSELPDDVFRVPSEEEPPTGVTGKRKRRHHR